MPYCENCGKELKETSNFCGTCGTPVAEPAKVEAVSAPAAVESTVSEKTQESSLTEPVLGVILLRKPKSLGRYDTFSGVLTNKRLVFAQMTSDMLKDIINKARAQAKAEGKGFFGQWGEQLKASSTFAQRYYTMEPSVALSETAGNFEIQNSGVSEIKLKRKSYGNSDNNQYEFEIEFKGSFGKYKFKMDENNNYVNSLKQVYGDKVKAPKGYFSKGGISFRIG
ncbi:MAG: zinc ribbon domain-containing protein [Candidatus Bathyarchaeota archaeon]|nr:zinc ribbon domain-containing protein [Candidatus Bathyarchaeum tardum]WNZ28370.1 MAG: zinc ribbon domain-containing protein [Candidatus Bathyarchaeota archaeon]